MSNNNVKLRQRGKKIVGIIKNNQNFDSLFPLNIATFQLLAEMEKYSSRKIGLSPKKFILFKSNRLEALKSELNSLFWDPENINQMDHIREMVKATVDLKLVDYKYYGFADADDFWYKFDYLQSFSEHPSNNRGRKSFDDQKVTAVKFLPFYEMPTSTDDQDLGDYPDDWNNKFMPIDIENIGQPSLMETIGVNNEDSAFLSSLVLN